MFRLGNPNYSISVFGCFELGFVVWFDVVWFWLEISDGKEEKKCHFCTILKLSA